MTREEAIRIIKIVLAVAEDFEITVRGEEFTEEKCKEAVDMAIEALEQEPCTDAIRRQEMRLIDANALKKDLTRFYDNEVTAKQLIDEQPTIRQDPCGDAISRQSEKPNKWIPVSERLPEDHKDVLICLSSDQICIGCYNSHKLPFSNNAIGWGASYTHNWCSNNVIAWMPLPEPYKASPTGAERSDKE